MGEWEDGLMFVKICGLREPATLRAAIDGGADAVGFVMAPGSPRTISPADAHALVALVPYGIETVGVFRSQSIDEVLAMAAAAGVQTIQFHGHEPIADLDRARAQGYGVIRALSVPEYLAELEADPDRMGDYRLLLDAPIPGAGIPFDPSLLLTHRPAGPWLLAGGLTPGNVAALIDQVRPGGVDVSSGVESSRGVKHVGLIADFIAAARSTR